MLVSFVIPVYNVQLYLRECVSSITSQTYKDIEVILVDDGSKDESPVLCEQLASEDNRIKVIHKENGGLSDARNCGLRAVHGEYVVFLDSDDFWIGKDSLQKIVNLIKSYKDLGFVNYNCCYYYSDKGYTKWIKYNDELLKPVNSDVAIQNLVASGTFPMSACFKAISTQLLRNNELLFKVGMLCEDIPWFIDLLDYSKKSLFVNEYIYAYRQNVGTSITRNFGLKSFDSIIKIIEEELEKLETRSFSDETKDYIKSFLAYEFCICLGNLNRIEKGEREERRKQLIKYKWLLAFTQNPKVRKVSLLNSIFGLKVAELALRFFMYQKYRRG